MPAMQFFAMIKHGKDNERREKYLFLYHITGICFLPNVGQSGYEKVRDHYWDLSLSKEDKIQLEKDRSKLAEMTKHNSGPIGSDIIDLSNQNEGNQLLNFFKSAKQQGFLNG